MTMLLNKLGSLLLTSFFFKMVLYLIGKVPTRVEHLMVPHSKSRLLDLPLNLLTLAYFVAVSFTKIKKFITFVVRSTEVTLMTSLVVTLHKSVWLKCWMIWFFLRLLKLV
jgi:hypothetical protein